ncbi:hypothetical protein Tco_0754845 [Tanacetum coccineum]
MYNGKVLLEKHDPPVVYDSEETLELAQESGLKTKQLNKEIKPVNYTKINHLLGVFVSQMAKSREELYFSNTSKTANVSKSISIPNEEFSDDTTPKAAKFVRDFQSLANEADESLAKHKELEFEIERLLRAVVSQDIMSIVQNNSVVGKPPSSSRLKLYSVTPFPKSKGLPKIDESHTLSKPVTSNSIPIPQESKVVKNNKVIALECLGLIPKQKAEVKKPKKVGSKQRLASPTPSEPSITRRWLPTGRMFNCNGKIIKSRASKGQSNDDNACCSKHLTRNLKLLINFVWKFLGTVRFGNDHVAAILGFDLEVAFRRNTCFVRNLEGVDLLKGNGLCISDLPHGSCYFYQILVMAEAIATACYTQNHSIIHHRFNKMTYELINGRKPVISFRHVFEALFYNRRTKKIMKTTNVTFDELSAMAFEQTSSKPGLQGMNSGQISSGFNLTYDPSTITTQKPTERELDLLFEAMYDNYIGGQPSAATRTAPAAQAPYVLQTQTTSIKIVDTAPTPTNSLSQATNILNTSHDVDELETQ